MRQALLVQAEHHHPQARAQVIALEQAGEGGDRRLRAHRIAALALHAQCVGQRLQAFVHQLQRMQELGVEKRSEEHTSELQSLMRISYAVICLKKKKTKQNHVMTNL